MYNAPPPPQQQQQYQQQQPPPPQHQQQQAVQNYPGPPLPPMRPPYGTHAPPPVYEEQAPAPVAPRLPAHALRGFLISYQANPGGDYWTLRGGRLSVGRIGSNDQLDIQLADPTISSRHASITVDNNSGTIVVEDTGSTNGTFVNEEHLGFNGRRELRDGDTIRFGGFNTVVKIVGDPR